MKVADNTKIALGNFGLQNTPISIEKIGNFLLILAAIGVAIQTLPMQVPDIIIPKFLLTISNWLIGLGVIGKVITKFFGTINPNQ